MPPRPIDFVGAAILTLVLFALVAVLFIGNIPVHEG
jgi:hypothetical protein